MFDVFFDSFMPQTFLILLGGGIMLAAAVCEPQQVTLNWLRLCGILALVMSAVSMFFLARSDRSGAMIWMLNAACVVAILGQVAFAQLGFRRTQQALAVLAFFISIRIGAIYFGRTPITSYAAAIGIAAMSGLALMDMLLGHAYLTASKMTIAPFRRLNAFLAGTMVWRAIIAGFATTLMTREIWLREGVFILTRWLVGLAVPAVFVYMAHDCIKRRSTQSATGILYVAGVLIFIGELMAVYLVRASGLPF